MLSDFLSANRCSRPGRLQGRGVLPESGVWEHVAVTQPSGQFLLQEDERYSERKIALRMFFLSLPLLSLSLISTKEDIMGEPSPVSQRDVRSATSRASQGAPSLAADSSNLVRARGCSPFLVLGFINRSTVVRSQAAPFPLDSVPLQSPYFLFSSGNAM